MPTGANEPQKLIARNVGGRGVLEGMAVDRLISINFVITNRYAPVRSLTRAKRSPSPG